MSGADHDSYPEIYEVTGGGYLPGNGLYWRQELNSSTPAPYGGASLEAWADPIFWRNSEGACIWKAAGGYHPGWGLSHAGHHRYHGGGEGQLPDAGKLKLRRPGWHGEPGWPMGYGGGGKEPMPALQPFERAALVAPGAPACFVVTGAGYAAANGDYRLDVKGPDTPPPFSGAADSSWGKWYYYTNSASCILWFRAREDGRDDATIHAGWGISHQGHHRYFGGGFGGLPDTSGWRTRQPSRFQPGGEEPTPQLRAADVPSLGPQPSPPKPPAPAPAPPTMPQHAPSAGSTASGVSAIGDVTYAGALTITDGFTPDASCAECMLKLTAALPEVDQLAFIVEDCKEVTSSKLQHLPAGIARLSHDDAFAVAVYSYDLLLKSKDVDGRDNFFVQLNERLRLREATVVRNLRPYLFYLFHALDQLPRYEGVVLRGIPAAALDVVKERYTTGREIFWSAFTSTTTDIATAKNFAQAGGIVFRVRVGDGRLIKAYSALPNEDEVLLKPNTKFAVTKPCHLETTGELAGFHVLELLELKGKFIF